jgi:predicted transcriptional regulator
VVDAASLGERELDVMTVLWQQGSGTVTEVQGALVCRSRTPPCSRFLRNLEAKGFLRRAEEGRAHRYFPKVKQTAEQRRGIGAAARYALAGSPEALIAQLVDDHDLSPKELKRIAKRLRDSSGDKGARHDRHVDALGAPLHCLAGGGAWCAEVALRLSRRQARGAWVGRHRGRGDWPVLAPLHVARGPEMRCEYCGA